MNKIPKNIFQIYHDKSLIKSSVISNVKKINPDYNYKLYDFDDGIKIVEKDFDPTLSKDIVKYLIGLERYAHKSDLLRYCLLYLYGGVYIDIDLHQITSFNDIIKTGDSDLITSFGLTGNLTKMDKNEFIENNQLYQPLISNGFLISIKNNPIILDLIKHIITLPFKNRHGVNIYFFHNYLKRNNNNNNLVAYKKQKIKNNTIYLFKEQTIDFGGKNAFFNKMNEIIMYSNNYLKKSEYLNRK